MKSSKSRKFEEGFALRPIAFGVMLACAGGAWANPTGPKVGAGAATFHTKGNTLSVANTPGTIINWQSFSIGGNELTKFIQQSPSSAVLNRVVGSDGSNILGSLTSNGRVFLINPHGIVFGAGARIDTAGFIASTLNMADRDFLRGVHKFEGGGNGVLRNEGVIRARGDIMLVGPIVENAGLIRSDSGAVLLAAGKSVTITSPDVQGVKFEVQAPGDRALNLGRIEAYNSAAMFAGTLVHSGDIRAVGADVQGARVILSAQKEASVEAGAVVSAGGKRGGSVLVQSGDVAKVAGRIDATGSEGPGGTVHVLGERVLVDAGAVIDASGRTGGGTILVGGDFQGGNRAINNASQTIVERGASLNADATGNGDGGKVIVWADDITRYRGEISARGGERGGDGGFVEVSGKKFLEFAGTVDTRAPQGKTGTLLLDPTTVDIVAGDGPAPNTGTVGASRFQDVADAPATSEITVGALRTALLSNDVVISTESTGTGAGDINLNTALNFDGVGTARKLTLVADRNINLANPITDSNSASADSLSLVLVTRGPLWATNISHDIALGPNGVIDASRDGTGVINFVSGAAPTFSIVAPIRAKTVNFNSGGTTVQLASTVAADAINLQGGTLDVQSATGALPRLNMTGGMLARSTFGDIVIDGAFTVSGGVIGAGPTANDFLRTEGATSVTGTVAVARDWINNGTVDLGTLANPFASIQLQGGATFRNQATVNIVSEFPLLFVGGAVTNAPGATINKTSIGPNTIASAFENAAGGAVNINSGDLTLSGAVTQQGRIEIASGAVLSTGGADLVNGSSGVIGGNGTIDLALGTLTNQGTLRPGAPSGDPGGSIGTLTVFGNVTFANGSNLDMEIRGPNGDNDKLVVGGPLGGQVTLGGNLNVTLPTGFEPEQFSGAELLTYAFRNGVSDFTINSPVGYTFTPPATAPNSYTVTATSVPALITWTGNGGDLTWENPQNWSDGMVPTAANNVDIGDLGNLGVDTTITVSTAQNARRLTSRENLTILGPDANLQLGAGNSAVTNSVTNDAHVSVNAVVLPATLGVQGLLTADRFSVSGSVVEGSGRVVVNGALTVNGAFLESIGGITGNGLTTFIANPSLLSGRLTVGNMDMSNTGLAVQAGGRLTLGPGTKNMTGSAFLAVEEGATVSLTGDLTLSGNALLGSAAGSRIEIADGNASIVAVAASNAQFSNAGTLVKLGTGTLTIGNNDGLFFSNSGTLDIQNANATIIYGAASNLFVEGTRFIGPGEHRVTTNSMFGGAITSNGLTLASGNFSGAATFNGTTTWTGGTIQGAYTFPEDSTLNITGSGAKRLEGAAASLATSGTVNVSGSNTAIAGTTWDNFGVINLSGAGQIAIENASTLRNRTDGFIHSAGEGSVAITGAGSFLNEGTFNKNAGPVVSQRIDVPFDNAGIVNVRFGTLELRQGGTDTGTYAISDGARLDMIGGNRAFEPAITLPVVGSGTLSLSGGELDVRSGVLPRLDMIGGILTRSTAGDVTIDGPFVVSGGSITPGGGGELITAGATTVTQVSTTRNWRNTGDLALNAGQIVLATAGVVFTNEGNLDINTGTNPFANNGSASIINSGTINKNTLAVQDFGNPFTNLAAGTVNVNEGTLRFTLSGTQSGTFMVAQDHTLEILNGTTTFTPGAALTGPGRYLLSGGTLDATNGILPRLTMTGGTLTRSTAGDVTIDGPFVVSGGSITPGGGGELITAGATTVTQVATTRNWRNTGDLALNAGQLVLATSGVVFTNEGNLAINTDNANPFSNNGSASIINSGVINKNTPTLHDFGNPFTNLAAGTVNVNEGTLRFTSSGTQSGTLVVAQDHTLEIATGTTTFAPGAALTGPGRYLLSGGTLDVTTDGALSRLTMTGGTLTRSTAGDVTIDGPFVVSGGSITPGGGGELITAGATTVTQVATTRNWRNTGDLALNAGQLVLATSGVVFTNEGNLEINTANNNPFGNNGSASIINSGVINKNTPTLHDFGNPFTNLAAGTVNVNEGTLRFTSSGTQSGTLVVAQDHTLEIATGTTTFAPGAALTGPGRYLLSGGTLDVTTDGALSRLTMTGGTLTRSTAGDVTIDGPFVVSGGSITAGGGGELITAGATTVTQVATTRNWRNTGDLALNAGQLVLATGGVVFTNQGNLEINTDNNNPFGNNGSASIINSGTINKNTPALHDFANPFTNLAAGTVNVNEGTLRFTSSGTQSGTLVVAQDHTLEIAAGTTTFAPGVALTGPGRYLLSGGTLDVTTDGALSRLTMTGGTLTRSTAGDVTIGGPFVVSGGSITAGGGGELITAGATTVTQVATTRNWRNTGDLALNAGQLVLATGGVVFTNQGNLEINTDNNNPFGNNGSASIINSGTINKNTPALHDFANPFTNLAAGTVNVNEGTLRFTSSGTQSGTLVVAQDHTLEIANGTTTFAPGVSLTGPGRYLLSGGTLDVTTDGALSRLTMTGGTLTRSTAGDVTIGGPFVVSGGSITAGGGGELITAGATTVTQVATTRNWRNTGDLDLNAGQLVLAAAGVVFTNEGNLAINTDNANPFSNNGSASIINSGVINKNTPALHDFGNPFTNLAAGTVNVNAGSLRLPFTPTNDGTMHIAAGATLSTASKNLTNLGLIGGGGTLDLGGATLTNFGTLQPGGFGGPVTGTLSILGNLTLEAGGVVDLQLGGTGSGQFDAVNVSGSAALAGTLALSTTGGYVPASGDAFTVITSPALSGSFDTITKTFPDAVTATYAAASLSLSIGSSLINLWIFNGNDSWDNPARWSLGHVPTPGERVTIDRPGELTITVPAGAFGADRLTSAENITIAAGGTLGLANASTINGTLALNGGTLQGAGPVTVNGDMRLDAGRIASTGGVTVTGITRPLGDSEISGRLTVNEFRMTNGGSLNILAGGVLNLAGGATKRVGDGTLNQPVINNAGTITLAGRNLVLDGANVNITDTGRFEILGDVGIQSLGGPLSTLDNAGTIAKTGGALTSTIGIGPDSLRLVSNNGIFDAQTGILELASAFNTFNDGTRFIGAGSNVVTNNSTFNGTIFSNGLTLQSGNFTGTASLTGTTTWTGGTMTGAFTVPSGATINLTGAGAKAVDGAAASLANSGAMNLSGNGSLTVSGGAAITNHGTANWNAGTGSIAINADSTFTNNGTFNLNATTVDNNTVTGTGTFQNSGTLSSNTTGINTFAARFDNAGTVSVGGGTLVLSGGGTDTGAYSLDAGTTLDFAGGTRNLNAGASVTGAGALVVSNGTANFNANVDVASFTVSGGTANVNADYAAAATTISGGAANFNNANPHQTGTLTLSGGVLGGTGNLTANGGTWTGGRIEGPQASLTIASGALLNITGGSDKTVDGATVTNTGEVNLSGTGNLVMNGGAVLDNPGIFNILSDASILNTVGTATIENTGSFNKLGGTGTSVVAPTFNSGNVGAISGTLSFTGGGTDTGAYAIEAGATLDFGGGTRTLNPGTLVYGAGTLSVSGGTLNVNADYDVARTSISGGTANFNADVHQTNTLTFSGGTISGRGLNVREVGTWTGGTVAGANATLTIGDFAVFDVTGNAAKTLDGARLFNASLGTLNLSGDGNLVLNNGARVDNAGVFDILTDASIRNTAGAGTFANTWVLRKSGGSGVSVLGSNSDFVLSNAAGATIDVQSGTLRSAGAFPANAGTINLASGATFSTTGAALTNADTGTIGGFGTLALGGATLTNNGTLQPGGPAGGATGTLRITGDLTQGTGGRINVKLGNGGASDVVAVSGNASLDGTLNLSTTGGYTATQGDDFTVLTSGTRSGFFDTTTKTFANEVIPTYAGSGLSLLLGSTTGNTWIFDVSGDWTTGRLWSQGRAPIATDQVVIDRPVDLFTVTIPAGVFSANTLRSTENVTVLGTLDLSGASSVNGTLAVNGGTLQGAGPVAVTGTLSLDGATLAGPGGVAVTGSTNAGGVTSRVANTLTTNGLAVTEGGLTVDAGGTLNLTGAGARTITGATLANAGTVNLSGAGNLVLNDGAVLNNAGIFNIQADAGVANTAGAATFANTGTGTVRKSGGAGVSTIATTFNNAGSVAVESGVLRLTGSGTDTGVYSVAAGTAIDFGGGTRNLDAGTTVIGPGTLAVSGGTLNVNVDYAAPVTVISGGTANFNANVSGAETFAVTGGTANVNADYAALTTTISGGTANFNGGGVHATNTLNLTGGTLGGTGDLTVNSAGTWSGGRVEAATLTINGVMNLTGDATKVVDGATVVNFGTVNLAGDGTLALNNGATLVNSGTFDIQTNADVRNTAGAGAFANAGTLVKSGGTGVSVIGSNSDFALVNGGTIDVQSGTLRSGGSFAVNAGTINLEAGTTFSTTGAALTNVGLVRGAGTLALGGETFTNFGTVAPGTASDPTGQLTIAGGFAQSLTGRTEVELGGTGQGRFDTLSVSGNAALDGTLALSTTGGYTPVIGDTFNNIVTSGTRSGFFDTTTRTFANEVIPTYAGSGLTLRLGTETGNTWIFDVSGDWTNPKRWSQGRAPIATDQVVIDRPAGEFTVTLPAGDFSADTLRSTENVTLAGTSALPVTLTLAGASSVTGTLAVNGGTLQGTGPVTVTGTLALDGATLAGAGGVTVSGSTNAGGATSRVANTLTTNGLAVTEGGLTVDAGATLGLTGAGARTITGSVLTNNGTVDLGGTSEVTLSGVALLDNFGALNLGGATRIVLGGDGGATLVNRGGATVTDTTTSASPITAGPGAAIDKLFVNAGTFTKAAGSAGVQTIGVPMTNTGVIEVLTDTLAASVFPLNSGVLDLREGATFSTTGNALTNAVTGLLKGDGTLNVGAATFTNNGVVAPGASAGTLTIEGNFAQGPGGTLAIELGGTVAGTHYDLFRVTGNATLDGTLAVTALAGQVLQPETAYDFMTYASRTGDFTFFTIPPFSTFVVTPGATFYRFASGPTVVTPEVLTVLATTAQRDSIILSDRAFDATQGQTTTSDGEKKNEQECR